MKEFIGKNKNFVVIWVFLKQEYFVYHKGKYLGIKAYRYRDIASYIN